MTSRKTKENLVSILICSRDRRVSLENLVKSLNNIDTTRSFEVIVVEETDNPIEIDGVQYIFHPVTNQGIPYARNLAVENASGDIIAFLDDDCKISNGWLDNLLEPLKDDSIVGVQGGVTLPESSNSIGWVESILGVPGGGIRRILQAGNQIQATKEISTLNCAYRRSVIEKVGGFEKELKMGGEDYLSAKQVCLHGRCVFVPWAIVYHEARGNLIEIWHWFVRRGRAEVNVIRTGKQKETNCWTVLKGSLTIKLCSLIFMGIIFPGSAILLTLVAVSAYGCLQYVRYYKTWKESPAPIMSFCLLPVVKSTMDTAMDWGRIRAIFFD